MNRVTSGSRFLVLFLIFQLIQPWRWSAYSSVSEESPVLPEEDEVVLEEENPSSEEEEPTLSQAATAGGEEEPTLMDEHQVTIGATGAAGFELPIFTPPGRQGVSSGISLTYSSQGGIDTNGFGWSVDLGKIERSTRMDFADYSCGENNTVDDSQCEFEYIFKRNHGYLVFVSEYTNGSNEKVYVFRSRVEGESVLFELVDTNRDRRGEYWKVTESSPAGMVHYFGTSSSSQIITSDSYQYIFRWGFQRAVDRSGNTVIVEYQKDNGYLYLYRVKYTGFDQNKDGDFSDSGELSPQNEVEYTREKNCRNLDGGYSNAGYTIKQRYSKIIIKHDFNDGDGMQLVRQYDLVYSNEVGYTCGTWPYEQLAEFKELDSSGATLLRPPFKMEYYTNDGDFAANLVKGTDLQNRIEKLTTPLGGLTTFHYNSIWHMKATTDYNSADMDGNNVYVVNTTRNCNWDPDLIGGTEGTDYQCLWTRYEYRNGYYDTGWKEFRGAKYVTSYPANKSNNWQPLSNASITERRFIVGKDEYTDPDYYKGLVKSVTIKRASDSKVLHKVESDYILQSVASGIQRPLQKEVREVTYEYIGASQTPIVKARKKEFQYDSYGNATSVIDYGEVNSSDFSDIGTDKRTAKTSYINNTTQWLIGFPCESWIEDNSGAKYKETQSYYDNQTTSCSIGSRGLLTSVNAKLDGSWKSISKSAYDKYGNVREAFDANALAKGVSSIDPDTDSCTTSKATACTDYDSTYHQFPVTVRNALGQTVQTQFDTAIGKPTQITAPTGAIVQSEYDALGRLIKVAKPGNTLTNPSKCIFYVDYEASMENQGVRIYEKNGDETFTCTSESTASSNGIWAKKYVDGMGRTTKTLAKGVKGQSTSGSIRVDNLFDGERGLNNYVTNPFWDDSRTVTETTCDNGTDKCTANNYDVLARLVKVTTADGREVESAFKPWISIAIDPNKTAGEAYWNVKYEEKDAFGNTVIVKEGCKNANCRNLLGGTYSTTSEDLDGDLDGDGTIEDEYVLTTRYTYDPLNNLLLVTDAEGNPVMTNTYDEWGRKLTMTDLDAGGNLGKFYQYGYDLNGNLTWQRDAKGQRIEYQYDVLNRVVRKKYKMELKPLKPTDKPAILYPKGVECAASAPGAVFTYQYDDEGYSSEGESFCGSASIVYAEGKVAEGSDPSGSTIYCYDPRGRVVKKRKIVEGIAQPFDMAWTYYDNDVVKTLTYPGGYVVTYGYRNGQLNSVWEDKDKDGAIGTTETVYVKSFEYNSASQIELIELGNGLYTDYTYDLQNGSLRLQSIVTCNAVTTSNGERFCSAGSNRLQDMVYDYDPVGNILSIADKVENETQRFLYDDLYRLTCGDVYPVARTSDPGTCGTDPDSEDGLGLTYQRYYGYDAIGNMRTHGDSVEGFTWVYSYDETEGAGPHAVTRIITNSGETFNFYYDSNGNMVSIPDINREALSESRIREATWDFENRMSSLVVKSWSGVEEVAMDFTYDDSGWRVIKENETSGEFTTYIDKLFEVGYEIQDDGANIFDTKYIFAGDRRIAHIKNDYGASANNWVAGPLSAGSIGLPWGGGISFDPAMGTIALALLLLLLPYGIARWGFRRWVPVAVRFKEGVVVATLILVVSGGVFFGLGGVKFRSAEVSPSVMWDYDQETLDQLGKVRTPSVGAEGKVYLP